SLPLGGVRLGGAGHGKALLLFAAGAVIALLVNRSAIEAAGLQTQAVKQTSYLLSIVIAFVLVSSTIRSVRDLNAVVIVMVLGGLVVACAAIYESRTHHNVFDHLEHWLPFLKRIRAQGEALRGGRLRVRASSQ